MKPLPIIISIVLLVVSIARLANSCSKREKREKTNEFAERRQSIDLSMQKVLMYSRNDPDSIDWIATHNNLFNEELNLSIKYYRDNYYSDEERYKAYLNKLYVYKKISYLYTDWVKQNREYAAETKKDVTKHLYKYNEYTSKLRSLNFELSRSNIELITLD